MSGGRKSKAPPNFLLVSMKSAVFSKRQARADVADEGQMWINAVQEEKNERKKELSSHKRRVPALLCLRVRLMCGG